MPNPLITWKAPLAASPFRHVTQGHSRSHLTNLTHDTFIALILGNAERFRSPVAGPGSKTEYVFLVLNHNITEHFTNRLVLSSGSF